MVADSQEPSLKARGHGEFLKLWESNAPLTDEEVQLCAHIEAKCASASIKGAASEDSVRRSATRDILKSNATVDDNLKEGTKSFLSVYKGHDGLKGLAEVTTPEEFHLWHDEMERRLQDANEDKYHAIIEDLERDRAAVSRLLALVSGTETSLAGMDDGRQFVDSVVARFKLDCENMVSDRKKMGELADALRKRLTYFEELETLTAKLGGGPSAVAPTNSDFVKLLHRLDECVAYASSSTGAVAEADGYLARFLDLQRRAFSVIRDHTVSVLRSTAATVARELRDDRLSGAGFRHADLTDASKEYLRFRTIAPRIKLLMTELHARAHPKDSTTPRHHDRGASPRSSYHRLSYTTMDPYPSSPSVAHPSTAMSFSTRSFALSLYADCEECFFDERKRLLEPSVSAHVKSLADVRNMIALARLGSAYVLRVCQLERQLYEHFFPVDDPDGDENPTLLTALRLLCDMVYIELRPQILQEEDLDKLVYLIEVLKTEILGDEVPRRGFAGKAFAPSALRAIADAQERIIYRAEVFIRDEIRGFIPQPHHLDYPNRILQHLQRMADAKSDGKLSTPRRGGATTATEKTISAGNENASHKNSKKLDLDMRSVGIYATWYPPVERTLRLLSMLYRCVEGEVFAGVAQEAVAICVQSVGSAAARIAASDQLDAEDHAQLFLVWQLLMTREQISPFDVEMSYTEHELDFFELRSLLGSVIRGRVSARTLASRPTIRERVVDSKRDLDQGVRGACEAFILKTTRTLLDPLLSFLAKCNALPSVSSSDAISALDDNSVDAPPTPSKAPFDSLKSNPGSFAHPKRVNEMWSKIKVDTCEHLPAVVERMKIYITKFASRGVLLRPIRANIAEAATELLSVLQVRYTLEERETIGINGEDVEQLLDEVDRVTGIDSPLLRTKQ